MLFGLDYAAWSVGPRPHGRKDQANIADHRAKSRLESLSVCPSWTSLRFMGVKLVPPGLHYLYCSASAGLVTSTACSPLSLSLSPVFVSLSFSLSFFLYVFLSSQLQGAAEDVGLARSGFFLHLRRTELCFTHSSD